MFFLDGGENSSSCFSIIIIIKTGNVCAKINFHDVLILACSNQDVIIFFSAVNINVAIVVVVVTTIIIIILNDLKELLEFVIKDQDESATSATEHV